MKKNVGARLGGTCRRGHTTGRTLSGACKGCNRLAVLRRREAKPTAQKEASAKWRENNLEKAREHQRNWIKNNPEKVRAKVRKHLPKPTRPEPCVCEICSKPNKSGRAMALDHCHKTNTFRGWLCTRCNAALGALGDTYAAVIKAAHYLKQAENLT